MRWTLYLLVSFIMQIVAWIITPLLPLFAVQRMGAWDNAREQRMGYRLPLWLSWFDTPDNALCGDWNFIHSNFPCSYMSKVKWLYRNSLYGFKWSVLSAPMDASARVKTGQQAVGWKNPGFQRIRMGDYWQWHLVKVIGPFIVNLNFGWLLNDGDAPRALFMFSPRIRITKA